MSPAQILEIAQDSAWAVRKLGEAEDLRDWLDQGGHQDNRLLRLLAKRRGAVAALRPFLGMAQNEARATGGIVELGGGFRLILVEGKR